MRITFIFILVVHGLIHLIGLLSALGIISGYLKSDISKQQGYFWGLAAVLFNLSGLLLFLGNELWWLVALLALINSQYLIIRTWKDSKFGTIVNLIILLGVIFGFANWSFDKSTLNMRDAMIPDESQSFGQVTPESLDNLPQDVQKWLIYSNVTGRNFETSTSILQEGRIRLEPDSEWMPFTARQWFYSGSPSFLWTADVTGKWLHFRGRDLLAGGKGSMLIKLYGLFKIVDAKGSKIDQGAMVRFLSEIIWMPWVATADYIKWEELGNRQVKASIHWNDSGGFGVFTFDETGRPVRFEAKRYYNRGNDFSLEDWIIDINPESFTSMDGILIPTSAQVSWELETGLFTWLQVEIVGF